MDKKTLELLKNKLLKEEKRLEKEIKEIEAGNTDQSQSEASGENVYEDHFADSGTATFERERDLSLERNIKDILERVRHALKQIKGRKYGVCNRCSKNIDMARLKALPYADLCIECKKREEESW